MDQAKSPVRLTGVLPPVAAAVLFPMVCASCGSFSPVFRTTSVTFALPSERNLAYEGIRVAVPDGGSLDVWLFPGKESGSLIVYFHGNGTNISDRLGEIETLLRVGPSVLIFDYRGFGQSTGKTRGERTLFEDGRSIIGFVRERGFVPSRTFYYGKSMGAGVALQMALEAPPAGLVLECPFTSLRNMARMDAPLFFYLMGWWWLPDEMDNMAKIGSLRVPLLVFQGTDDKVVIPEMARSLVDRAPPPKEFLMIEGAGHGDIYRVREQEFLGAWKRFILRTLESV